MHQKSVLLPYLSKQQVKHLVNPSVRQWLPIFSVYFPFPILAAVSCSCFNQFYGEFSFSVSRFDLEPPICSQAVWHLLQNHKVLKHYISSPLPEKTGLFIYLFLNKSTMFVTGIPPTSGKNCKDPKSPHPHPARMLSVLSGCSSLHQAWQMVHSPHQRVQKANQTKIAVKRDSLNPS